MDFELDEGFIDRYRNKVPVFGFNGLGEITCYRSYSREKEDGSKEDWWEVCRRVVEGTYSMQKRHIERYHLGWSEEKAQRSAQEMYGRMFIMKWLPPGRGLWAMGSPITEEKGLFAPLNNCFAHETGVVTKSGLKPIGELSGGTHTLLTDNGKWVDAPVSSFGRQELRKVTLSRAGVKKEVYATPGHEWIVKTKNDVRKGNPWRRIRTDALPAGSRMRYVFGQGVASITMSPQGVQRGFVFGDGTTEPNGCIAYFCGGKDKDMLEYFPLNHKTNGREGVIRATGLPFSYKDLPDIDESPSYLYGWISGYFAADGSMCEGSTPVISSHDRGALEFFADVCARLGIGTYDIRQEDRISNLTGKNRSVYTLSLMRDTLKEDFFLLEKHRRGFRTCSKAHWKVVSVSETDRYEEVFCATVPDTHSFAIEGNILTGNCAMVSTEDLDKNTTRPFCFLMDMSMLGVGVGFDVRGAGTVEINEPIDDAWTYVIPDTREGWVESLRLLILSYLVPGQTRVEFDYSNIRGKGEPIKTFGGVSSGPQPLIDLHIDVRELLDAGIGDTLSERNIVDIMNMIGRCVVSGNVRRSAELALGPYDSEEYLDLKDYEKNPERASYGWTSNNSILADVGMDYSEVAERTAMNGEPGYMWLSNARSHSRMSDEPDYKDLRAVGANPCQPAWASVLTPDGISCIGDIGPGDTVWDGYEWTKVVNKWSTGVKPVYGYQTNAGTFYGTENHRVVSGGEKVEAGKADSIDTCQGGYTRVKNTIPSCVMDGLVLGDGTLNTRVRGRELLLMVGDLDQDYFYGEVSHLIGSPKSWDDKCYSVETSLEHDELPPSWDRRIPGRYMRNCSKVEAASLLRGIFSANGSICGNRVTLKTTSRGLVEDVQTLLSYLGVSSYYTTNKPTTIKWDNGTYTSRESYDVNISTDRDKFAESIGFLQEYKNKKLAELVSSVGEGTKKKTYDIHSVVSIGEEEVFDITVESNRHTYWTNGLLVSNCVEQTLESFELCCLVETFPASHENKEDYLRTLKFAYLYAKSVTLGQTHWVETNRVMMKNRRIGCSMSGVAQFLAKHDIETLREWCDDGYKVVQGYDEVYSDWFAIPRSIKTTSIKPSGSVSLLAGATPGMHYPESRYYIRRIRIAKGSKLLDSILGSGYHVEDAVDDNNTVVVEVPVDMGEGVKSIDDVDMWQQLHLAAFLQNWWADNQVSCTVTLPHGTQPHEIASALDFFQYHLKAVSFLPRVEGGAYAQMPYETITGDKYRELASNLEPLNLSGVTGIETEVEKFCDSDVCMV